MNILILDVETTIYNKGHWADKRNKLVMTGWKWLNKDPFTFNNLLFTYDECRNVVQEVINNSYIVVGHNIKFDLHWLCNIGIDIKTIKRVWDTQIAEFLLEAQRNPYNSLNDTLDKYGFPRKLDVVKSDYWDKGRDTTEVPTEILREYLERDLLSTELVFKEQWLQFVGTSL